MTTPSAPRHRRPPSRRARPARRSRRRAGFTLIEIMMAMIIMIFGVMSIVQLQAQTMRATTLAREMGTATQLAQTTLEQLKLDAVTWTQVGAINPMTMMNNLAAPNVLGSTVWLHYITADNFTWRTFEYPQLTAGVTPGSNLVAAPAADFYGRVLDDDPAALANRHYCTSMRLSWVHYGRAMRADVRVYWRRETSITGGDNSLPDRCTDPQDATLTPNALQQSDYHAVYLSTVIPMTVMR